MAVRVDEPGHYDLAFEIDNFDIRAEFDDARVTDGGDLAVLDNKNALCYRRTGDRNYCGVDKRDRFFLSVNRTDEEQSEQKAVNIFFHYKFPLRFKKKCRNKVQRIDASVKK